MGWDNETEWSLAQPDPLLGTTLPSNCPPGLDSPNLADHPVQEVIEDWNLASWKGIYPLGNSISTLCQTKQKLNPGG